MKFIENPVGRELYKAGWQSKYLNKGRLSAILGTGVHAGIAAYYRSGLYGTELLPDCRIPLEEICDIASDTVLAELNKLYSLGALVGTKDQELADKLHLKAKTTTRKFIENEPLEELGFVVQDIELTMPQYGWCRVDIVVRPFGGETITAGLDWKTKLRLDPRYEARTIEEFAYSWQFMHYAWALGQYYNTKIREFYVGWISLEPKFRVQILEYFIDDEIMALWEQSAKTVWAIMAAMDGHPQDLAELIREGQNALPLYHTFNWFTYWGRDEYAGAVLDYKLHDDLLHQDYINTKES